MNVFESFFFFFLIVGVSAQEQSVYKSGEVDVFPRLIVGNNLLSDDNSEVNFQEQIQNHVIKTFKYPFEAIEKKITGKAYVSFEIDSSGIVRNIKARSKEKLFEQEAKRIFEALPKAEPAQFNGRNVSMVYSWPIVFNMQVGIENIKKEISPNLIESTVKAISYDETTTPPVFVGCEKSKNPKECFNDKLRRVVRNSKDLKLSNGQELIIKATVYFEIDKSTNLTNIVTIASYPEAKIALEKYLKSNRIVAAPGKNEKGESTICFYTAQLNLKAVGRSKKR